MKLKLLITIFSSIFLSSCLFDSDSGKIIGEYETVWIDIPQTRSINKGEEIIPAYVSEIGHNSNFIIAKQQPIKQGNIVTVHTDTTNYYIITVSDNSFQDKPVYGPLNKKSFDSLRQELKIENIKFDMFYPEY
ncbi:DUF3997 domain-containing protein [Lacibacter luteus]|uniref:DUF3997 domain-containing protein n=1 Tax=Lacibacter luteus TaxID=2508719 RepID=A0A4Q1CFW7_9BACT|nr:DUF3997 domain-containing protein [Lacibacter luteus]RXK58914.1 DUF3997 domain-containing protein [Lacibacter luteus]